jgi:hypothetical protein
MMRYPVLCFLLCLLPIRVASADESDSDRKTRITQLEERWEVTELPATDLLELGRLYFFEALDEDDAVDKAISVMRSEPLQNPPYKSLSQMYQAVLLALQGRYSLVPWRKLSYVNRALAEMDRLIKESPDSFEHRLLRATVTAHLPFFFSRGDEAQQDISLLKRDFLLKKEDLHPDVRRLARNFLHDASSGQLERSEQ